MENVENHVIGTAGHTIGTGRTMLTDNEREKIKMVGGCPVNKGVPTRMSRATFRSACLKFQEYAGITSDKQMGKEVRITYGGFKSNNKAICIGCACGNHIRGNRTFIPPSRNVTFIEFERPVVPSHPMDRESKRKVSTNDVHRIRALYQEGVSIAALLEMYPLLQRTAMSNIVNRVTWKNI